MIKATDLIAASQRERVLQKVTRARELENRRRQESARFIRQYERGLLTVADLTDRLAMICEGI